MRKSFNLIFALTLVAILFVGSANAQEYITGTQDDTTGVWLFSAGTDTEAAAEPTDEIVNNAIFWGILEYIGNEAAEVIDFEDGPPEPPPGANPQETPRDDTLALVVEGLTEVDDFGLIWDPDDPASNFDAGIGGWVLLGNFGDVYADGVAATGTLGPDVVANADEADDALDGCEIFLFEDATLSGIICELYTGGGATITFAVTDRQVDPTTPDQADDTLIAIDLDTLAGFPAGDYVTQIKITDDAVPMTNPGLDEDTTLELDAVATRIGVIYGSISGLKWHDENENGIKDPDENTLSNWHIYLSGDVTDSTTTAFDGTYSFTLPPGTYTISEEQRYGWNQTYPTPIPPGEYTNIVLNPDEHITDLDFGNFHPPSVGGEGELVAAATATYLIILLAVAITGAALYIALRGKLKYSTSI